MAFTRQVQDPQTGDLYWVTTYLRNGKPVTQRLPSHLFREGFTPKRLEALAAFSEAASRTYGSKQTTTLPPAAEAVRRELRRGQVDSSQESQ